MDEIARAAAYRARAAQIERKARTARTGEMRRAWLILARDWIRMAEKMERKVYGAPSIIPGHLADADIVDDYPRSGGH